MAPWEPLACDPTVTDNIPQYFDIPSIPDSTEDEIDIWFFVWGGDETDVPAGHSRALLLWEPSS